MLTGRVHVYGGNHCPCIYEIVVSKCHADQLTVAIGSPIAPQEQQDNGVLTVVRKGPRVTSLVG